jgi:hypothetical protein
MKGDSSAQKIVDLMILGNDFEIFEMAMKMKANNMFDGGGIRSTQEGMLHFLCIGLALFSAQYEEESGEELLLFEKDDGLVELMDEM